MITQYLRLTPAEADQLRRLLAEAPDEAYEFVDRDEDQARGMDTDKAWAGLEFLLAKLGPPVNVISGGTAVTDDEWGYDSPRLLGPDEVAEASRFLDGTPFARLAELYDPAELTAAEVYPMMWDEDWALEYLGGVHTALVTFFHDAAAASDSVLLWLN
ncbi:uncharacterized protein DUF1877 [Actinophytocola oryzae]|uniref:Uncharacterized protein DUF1877 n=2 Tax=Actinophytocola oryzae TaxID=502181 RepID=A0A4R7V5S0_9PSEU|nr:uncharacterized protein DUF1877 [Actinophytocola oryzae]